MSVEMAGSTTIEEENTPPITEYIYGWTHQSGGGKHTTYIRGNIIMSVDMAGPTTVEVENTPPISEVIL